MSIEKILVGDDQAEFAKQAFPYIPGAEIEFVDTPEKLLQKAKEQAYSVIVTDLSYTPGGREGFDILQKLKDYPARKILWTGDASLAGVREKGNELGAEVLDKPEIGSLVGQVASKARLKEGGKILVYTTESMKDTLEASTRLFFEETAVVVSSDLSKALKSGQYGLVIDTTTLSSRLQHGTVAHDMKYLKLEQVPRVVCIRDVSKAVVDIVKIAGTYLSQNKDVK